MVKYRCLKCDVRLSNQKLKHHKNSKCPHKDAVFLDIMGVKYIHPITQEETFDLISGSEHLIKLGGGAYLDATYRKLKRK